MQLSRIYKKGVYMNKIFFLVFVFSSVLFAQVNVVVSILPQQTFVKKIGADKVNVTTMVKPGSDPHSYEPKASQMIAISNADIYFPIKIEFENVWLTKFSEQNKNMKFTDMTKGVEFIKMKAHAHHHHHEHENHNENALPYEWAGLFFLKKGEYTWSFAKVDNEYADPAMKFLAIKNKTDNKNPIEYYEKDAIKLYDSKKIKNLKNGDNINTNNSIYSLNFDNKKDVTSFKISIKEDGEYLFFTEHMPFEFEKDEHFFKDLKRNDIEAIASVPESQEHHNEVDPHTWTSPSNVKIMAKNIYDALVKKDPINKSYYENNYNKFIEEIKQTDKKIKQIFNKLPKNSKFMVFHPSWGYFAKDYNLEQLSIEVEGKEPKPKMLKKIIEEAKEEKVKAIFTQKEFSDKSAKAIASQLNIKVIKETPLDPKWSENLIKMADTIANSK